MDSNANKENFSFDNENTRLIRTGSRTWSFEWVGDGLEELHPISDSDEVDLAHDYQQQRESAKEKLNDFFQIMNYLSLSDLSEVISRATEVIETLQGKLDQWKEKILKK